MKKLTRNDRPSFARTVNQYIAGLKETSLISSHRMNLRPSHADTLSRPSALAVTCILADSQTNGNEIATDSR